MADWVDDCIKAEEQIWKQREWTLYKSKMIDAWQERIWLALQTQIRADIAKWNGEFKGDTSRHLSVEANSARITARCAKGEVVVINEWLMISYSMNSNKQWIDYDCDDRGYVYCRTGNKPIHTAEMSELILKPLVEKFRRD